MTKMTDLDYLILDWKGQGSSEMDIAEMFDIPVGYVRQVIQRARHTSQAFRAWNPWCDLRERLVWNYGDAQARMAKMEDDIAKWRKLGR